MADAHTLYAQWVVEITGPPPVADTDLTIQAMCDAHLARMIVNGRSYVDRTTLFYARLVAFCAKRGIVRALDLTTSTLIQFQTELREGGASLAYVDKHLRMVSAAWRTSLSHKPNPARDVKNYNPDNTVVRFLSPEEEHALLDAAKRYVTENWDSAHPFIRVPWCLYQIILVALNTGLRRSNVLRLHRDEVDFHVRIISVVQKRGIPHTVQMNTLVHDCLRDIIPNEHGWFFPNPRTGQPYRWIDASWKKVVRMAGIEEPFRIHDLRHTFGTNLGEITGSPAMVKEALGHRSLTTTMKYFHVRPDALRAGIDSLVERFEKTGPEKGPEISDEDASD